MATMYGKETTAKMKKYVLRQHCVVACDDKDKCLAWKTLKKTSFEAN